MGVEVKWMISTFSTDTKWDVYEQGGKASNLQC